MCVPGAGRSCVPAICNTCSPASSSDMPQTFGRPVLDPGGGGARRKATFDRLAVERDRHLDVATTVDVNLQTLASAVVYDEHGFIERLVLIFEKQRRLGQLHASR